MPTSTDEVKVAVERLQALPGQDAEALELLLDYARGLHTTALEQRKLLVDARVFALTQLCHCEAGRKCERCRMVAGLGKVLG